MTLGCALPQHGADGAALRRLAPYLLLAVVLHVLLGLGLTLPAPALRLEPPPLRLSWRVPSPAVVAQPVRPPASQSAPERVPPSRSPRSARETAPVRVPPMIMPVPAVPLAPPASAPATSVADPPRVPVGVDLLDSARRMARDIGREAAMESRVGSRGPAAGRAAPAPAAIERAALPELERALRKRPAGEERLGGGILRITTESGRVYCLKPPLDVVRDGPVEPLAVPTNCP
ncbi:MAG: hypothetical protein JSR69_20325 [Proteobacteria bacterium]|nr:hypothetical protein [Pseudomonadota bacterium]